MGDGLAYIFPGQGTQRVGMGSVVAAASAAARDVYDHASELAGRDMFALCVHSDEETLTDTTNAQAAIYTTNAAVLAVVRDRLGDPMAVAGHSVGEWSAFHAAGVVDFATGFRAVRERARIMAASAGRGSMIAIVGLETAQVESLCQGAAPSGIVALAVENAPKVLVCAGEAPAVEAVGTAAEEAGAIRVARVRTSHGFHSPMISPAVGEWREYAAGLAFAEPHIPVAANLSGRLTTDPEELRHAAVEQLDHCVRWRSCVEALVDAGASRIVEVGDSKTLAAFVRSTVTDVEVLAMGAPNALRRLRGLDARSTADGGRDAVR